jgi:hypothetical protein
MRLANKGYASAKNASITNATVKSLFKIKFFLYVRSVLFRYLDFKA